MDDALFKAEIRCNQNQRKSQKAQLLINTAKTGVQHLAKLILAHGKADLLPPRIGTATTEVLLTDEDVNRSFADDNILLKLLAGAEDQITVVKEALSVGKQLAGSGASGEGEAEGGETDGEGGGPTSPGGAKSPKSPGGAAKELINAKPASPQNKLRAKKQGAGMSGQALAPVTEDTDLGFVRIKTRETLAEECEEGTVAARRAADDKAEMAEVLHVGPRDETLGMKNFLREALSTKGVMDQQRRVNVVGKHLQGPSAPRGLAMDDIIYEKAKSAEEKGSAISVNVRLQAAVSDKEQTVISADSIKQSANGIVNRVKANERRRKMREEAEKKRLEEENA